MSERKWTPGPWVIDYDNSDSRSGGQWYTVGPAVVHFDYGFSEETKKAPHDAHLIAAAPDLYEALEMVLAYDISGRDTATIMKALAKARGEQ